MNVGGHGLPGGFTEVRFRFAWLTVALVALAPASRAGSAEEVSVTGQRVLLRDVVSSCTGRTCDLDLGPAAPAGSSRLITVAQLRAALEAAGEEPAGYPTLRAVRVTSAAKVHTPQALAEWLRPSVEKNVPKGVKLVAVEGKGGATLPQAAVAGDCAWPALPRRPGPHTTTALVDVLHEGQLVRRVPLLLRVLVSESAAAPDVARGASITLIIERRAATISAQGVALKDSDVGHLAPFKVQPTGRVVNAIVRSAELATVVEQ